MSPRHRRPLPARGTSVLAALILVAALSTVVYVVEVFRPSSNTGSQTAVIAPLITGGNAVVGVKNMLFPPTTNTAGTPGVAKTNKTTELTKDSPKRCTDPIENKKKNKTTEEKEAEKKKVENLCVKGCVYKVTQKDATTLIKAEDTCEKLTGAAKKRCETQVPCEVHTCDPKTGKCALLEKNPARVEAALGRAARIPEYFTKDDEVKKLLEEAKKEPIAVEEKLKNVDPLIRDAFAEAKKEELDKLANEEERAKIKAKYYDGLLNKYAEDPVKLPGDEKHAREEFQATQTELERLEKEKANLEKVNLDRLAADKVTLKPDGEWKDTPWVGDDPTRKMECPGDPDCPGAPSKTGTDDPKDPTKKMFCPGDPDCPGEPLIPGRKVSWDTFCIVSIDPTRAERIPAGTPFPSGCYNTPGQPWPPPTNSQQQCPSGTYGTPPYCQRPYQGPPGSTFSNSGGWGQPGGGGSNSGLNSFLNGLMKGLTGQQQPPPPGNQNPYPNGTCQPNYVCSNNTLYFRNSQCVDQMTQTCQYGCQGTQCATSPQNQCPPAPAQPAASACPNGTWKEQRTTIATGASCVTGWLCTTGDTTSPVEPTAQISCQPRVADSGMSIAITYACGNATGSTGTGFSTGGQTSGATTTIAAAPVGSNTATYGLTCVNQDKTARAQCSVQIGRPSIVLVANPKTVKEGEASTVGWTTSGMHSCVVSSPDLPDFTAENENNTSVNGMASTPPLTKNTSIVLTCATLGGGERTATTSITVIEQTGPRVSVHSTFDGREDVTRGTVASIEWQVTRATSTNAAVALWLIDVQSQQSVALIAGGRELSGMYSWAVPSTGDPCPSETPYVCAGDMVPGRSYAVQASMYTPQNADMSRNPPAGAPRPEYIASGISAAFTFEQ